MFLACLPYSMTTLYREIQHILTFSLSTAEQSLNETQPQVVEKLVQGREKRLKLLDLTTNGRRKDLDQRSADTCAVNSAHLDGFQKKAAANNIIAKEMTLAATKKLLAILQEESGGGGAGAGGGGGGACVSGVAISSGGSSGVAGGGYVTPGKGKGDGVKASVSVSSGRLLV